MHLEKVTIYCGYYLILLNIPNDLIISRGENVKRPAVPSNVCARGMKNLMCSSQICHCRYFIPNYKFCSITKNHIHNKHYKPSIWITDLVSHILVMLCVLILCISGGICSLKSTLNDKFYFLILTNFSWHNSLLSNFLPEICCDEIAKEILFFCFTSNKPTHYPLGYIRPLDFDHISDEICNDVVVV